jgi:hypothetical protein
MIALSMLLLACWPDYTADWDGDGAEERDCDPQDGTVWPGAEEVWYDGVDQNCDGWSDFDADRDGYELPVDCDDTDGAIHPGATEIWYDGIDQNCDGLSDDDADGDGWDLDEDCDDEDPSVNPDAEEICDDGIDNNCDGGAPDCRLIGDLTVASASATIWGENGTFAGQGLLTHDVDGDGFGDLLLGAPEWGDTDEGSAYLIKGPITQDLDLGAIDWDAVPDGILAIRAFGSNTFGGTRAALADTDSDGVLEIVLGIPRSPALGASGTVFLVPSNQSGEIRLDISDGVVAIGSGYDATYYGSGVVGDGFGGLWVGASGSEDEWYSGGGDYHEYGQVFHLPATPTQDAWLEDLSDVTRYRTTIEGDGSGHRLALIGDMDGDGLPELAIGAPSSPTLNEWDYPGGVYVIDGGETNGSLNMPADCLVRLIGRSDGSETGYTLVGPGDVDGDGLDDLLIGGRFERSEDESLSQAGAVYLVTAATLMGLEKGVELWSVADARFTSLGYGTHLGAELGAAGDLDGDGYAEIAIHGYQDTTTLARI